MVPKLESFIGIFFSITVPFNVCNNCIDKDKDYLTIRKNFSSQPLHTFVTIDINVYKILFFLFFIILCFHHNNLRNVKQLWLSFILILTFDSLLSSGRCSIRARRRRMKNGTSKPQSSQISTNLIQEVAGSFDVMVPFRVYITSIEVMASGIAVLKWVFLKNSVI